MKLNPELAQAVSSELAQRTVLPFHRCAIILNFSVDLYGQLCSRDGGGGWKQFVRMRGLYTTGTILINFSVVIQRPRLESSQKLSFFSKHGEICKAICRPSRALQTPHQPWQDPRGGGKSLPIPL